MKYVMDSKAPETMTLWHEVGHLAKGQVGSSYSVWSCWPCWSYQSSRSCWSHWSSWAAWSMIMILCTCKSESCICPEFLTCPWKPTSQNVRILQFVSNLISLCTIAHSQTCVCAAQQKHKTGKHKNSVGWKLCLLRYRDNFFAHTLLLPASNF